MVGGQDLLDVLERCLTWEEGESGHEPRIRVDMQGKEVRGHRRTRSVMIG